MVCATRFQTLRVFYQPMKHVGIVPCRWIAFQFFEGTLMMGAPSHSAMRRSQNEVTSNHRRSNDQSTPPQTGHVHYTWPAPQGSCLLASAAELTVEPQIVALHSARGRSKASSCSIRLRHTMTTGPFPPAPSPVTQTKDTKTLAPRPRQQAPLPSADSICVTIASSSKFLRQQLSNAMVDFITPLRIVDRTAPDEDFPELIKFDVARGHNADGGAGSALCLSRTSWRCGRCATFAAIIRKEEKS